MSTLRYKAEVLAGDLFRRTQRTRRVGSLLGIPLEIKASFLVLLALVFIALGGLKGVVLVAVLFASVVAHELGHAVVARYYGMEVPKIELGFIGGAAQMQGMIRRANHEIAIAAAGPAVSLVLAGAGFGIGSLFGLRIATAIGFMNLVVAGFNLLPALPMDGGRILRAALTHRYPFLEATKKAATIARGFAVVFGLLGLYVGSFQLVFLAPLLWYMTNKELEIAGQIQEQFGGYTDDRDREIDQMARRAWSRQHGGAAFGGSGRRYTIRSVNGRIVIEALD
ncbi:MAG TPA: site-2 protease family protein [Kofleriaceae bacterium]|jgi:Zn-dependent protease